VKDWVDRQQVRLIAACRVAFLRGCAQIAVDSGRTPVVTWGGGAIVLRVLFGAAVLLGVWASGFAGAETAPASAGTPAYSEREVKAAFVFNFAKFTQWPEGAFPRPEDPVIIGVWGERAFEQVVEQTLAGKTAHRRPLDVRCVADVERACECHVLFIGAPQEEEQSKIIERLEGKSVLTVGEGQAFVRHGGMIGLVTKENKVRFEVNIDAAKRAGLRLSSELLKLATVVREGNEEGS